MPRRPRYLKDRGYYHILTRGNDRKTVFRQKPDYVKFQEILKIYLGKYPILILHYCLMPNHIHLLVQLNDSRGLPKFMQGVLQVYAHYFRKTYDSAGYMFQNRYKSLLIEEENYLLDCARYIERNPLRAGLVSDLALYPWSSFSYYVAGKENEIVNAENPIYVNLDSNPHERRRRFLEYVMQDRPYDSILDDFFRI